MIEVLKQALEALEANYLLVNGTETHGGLEQCLDGYYSSCFDTEPINKKTEEAITSLRQAIAELESQEPVAYINVEKRILEWAKLTSWETPTVVNLPKIPLYIHPPQRTWQGLTKEQLATTDWSADFRAGALWAEAKLKEKNT